MIHTEQAFKGLRAFIDRQHYPPTVAELGQELGVSKTDAHHHLKAMQLRGWIHREPKSPRGIKILRIDGLPLTKDIYTLTEAAEL